MARPDPRLRRPPGPAAWLNARRITAAGVFWPFLLLAVVAVPATGRADHAPWLTAALTAGVLALHALGSWWASGARSVERGVLRTLLLHGLGIWAGTVALAAIPRGLTVEDVFMGFMVAIGLTTVLAIPHGILLATAQRTLRRPGHDTRERVLVATGLAGALLTSSWPVASLLDPASFGPFPVAWTLLAVAGPLAAVVWGVTRRVGWRRWLRAVEAGEIAGWAVVDQSPRDLSRLVPVVAGPRIALRPRKARVLVWTQPTPSPFREAEMELPVALVLSARE